MIETPAESDQLPEEGPDEQVAEDTGGEEGTATGLEEDIPSGTPDEDRTATGNPDAAGADR
jgi:hypothetical protein